MLLDWLVAVPVLLQLVAWVLLPGLVAGAVLGLRGLSLWATAPVVSVVTISVSSLVGGRLGVAWGPVVVLVGTAVVVAVAGGLRLGLAGRGRGAGPGAEAGRSGWRTVALGLAAALPVAVYPLARGMQRADAVSQTYDAVFHLNALRFVVAERDASPLTLAQMTAPGGGGGIYPAAWHGIGSLPVLSGADPVVVTNSLALLVAGVVWPAGCALLVRVVVGVRPRVVAATALLSSLVLAFPTTLLAFGTLWPNALGLALVPVGVAAVVVLAGAGTEPPMARWQAAPVALAAVGATALSHPNALFAMLVLSALAVSAGALGAVPPAAGRRRAVLVATAVLAPVLTWTAMSRLRDSGLLGSLVTFDWPARSTFAQAAGEALLLGLNGRPAQWALAALVLLGAGVSLTRPRWAWLAVAHVVTVLGYAFASGTDDWPSQELTGLWYNDPHRMAAMVALTAVPLAGVGLAWGVDRLRLALHGRRSAVVTGLFVAAALVAVLASEQLHRVDRAREIGTAYSLEDRPGSLTLVSDEERDWLTGLASVLPEDAVVASDPWDGSGLLWALADRESLYPHLVAVWDDDRVTVATRLTEAASDPEVCAALDRLGVRWVISSRGERFWPEDRRQLLFDDIASLPAAGFRPVEAGAGMVLYEITACGELDAGR